MAWPLQEESALPILPLIDLLILMGTFSLAVGFVLKAVAITTIYQPTLLGFSSTDFVLITGVCFGMALVLVARTWLKLHEPHLLSLQSRLRAEQAARWAETAEEVRNGSAAEGMANHRSTGTDGARVG